MSNYLTQRNEIYYYMRRVPEHVAHIDNRQFIRSTLKTKNKKEAIRKAFTLDAYMEEYWESLLKDNNELLPEDQYRLASKLAQTHNFTYKTVTEIVDAPINKVLDRLNTAYKATDKPEIVSSVLGGINRPKLPLSACMDKFWPLCADKLINKSEHQIRKWKNPRKLAFDRFVQCLGKNKDLAEIDKSDILKFRKIFTQLIENQEMIGDTANKNLGYVRDILIALSIEHEVDIDFKHFFSDIKFTEIQRSRPPFEAQYVQDTYLKGDNLSGMNFEAKMLLYAMADTGARCSEIIGLRPEDIFLNQGVPYIWIQPYECHNLKTPESKRKIPLVGASLYAFKQLENGFRNYKNADSASSAVNKYLRENELTPSPQHSLYSLRHTLKDRLRDAGAPEEIIDEVLGHKKSGPKYGRGHLLEKKHEWLQKIAFQPPSSNGV